MADNNFRRYRGPAPSAASDHDDAASDFARDPLAELARLIGQGDPAAEVQGTRHSSAELLEHVASGSESFQRPVHESPEDSGYYGDDAPHGQLEQYHPAEQYQQPELHQQPEQYHQPAHYGEAPYAEPPSVESYPSVPEHDAGYETYETAAELPPIAAPHRLPALAPQDPEVEYAAEDQWDGYADGQSDAAHDFEYPPANPRGRAIVVMALSLVGLMVVGSATAFAYRAVFGGKFLPSMPPIIMASGGPNKIVPPTQTASASQPGAATPGGGEQLLSREEQPVQVQPTNPPPPRVVSTVPVMPAASAFPQVPPPLPQVVTPAAPPSASASIRSAPPAATAAAPEPKKVHTVSIPVEPARARTAPAALSRPMAAPATRANSDEPLSLVPMREAPRSQLARAEGGAATESTGSGSGGYTVQLTSQHTEAEAKAAYRSLRSKFPQELGSHEPIIRRADLGAKGTFYRAMVGPFGSAEAAAEICSKLKAAGGSCIVQRN